MTPIELKPKGLAKGGQGSFGGIGLGGLKRNVMHLARRYPSAFPAAMTLADDGGALRRNRQPHPGDIDGKEGVPLFSRASTQRDSMVSRDQPSKPKMRLASEIAYQPSR